MKHHDTLARLAADHDSATESASAAPVALPSAHVDNASRRLLTREDSGREETLFQPPAPRIPLSTYRLQFNRDFTFNQARGIVPYLSALGISHLYASPYLKARPGSRHGYDIIYHNALNPEIGTYEEFVQLCATLAEHGMGQVLDVVPNHMGVQGGDNVWWLDVLENGQASAHAGFFDIDWMPVKAKLRGKVLLPVPATLTVPCWTMPNCNCALMRNTVNSSFITTNTTFRWIRRNTRISWRIASIR